MWRKKKDTRATRKNTRGECNSTEREYLYNSKSVREEEEEEEEEEEKSSVAK